MSDVKYPLTVQLEFSSKQCSGNVTFTGPHLTGYLDTRLLLTQELTTRTRCGCVCAPRLYKFPLVPSSTHHITTSVWKDLHRWCIMMQHHQLSTSMVSAGVENVQNFQFEPPNQEDVPICLSLPISKQYSLSGLDFSVFSF